VPTCACPCPHDPTHQCTPSRRCHYGHPRVEPSRSPPTPLSPLLCGEVVSVPIPISHAKPTRSPFLPHSSPLRHPKSTTGEPSLVSTGLIEGRRRHPLSVCAGTRRVEPPHCHVCESLPPLKDLSGEPSRAPHHWTVLVEHQHPLTPLCLLSRCGARSSHHLAGALTHSTVVTPSTVSEAPEHALASPSLRLTAPEPTLASHTDAGPRQLPEHRVHRKAPSPTLVFCPLRC
jgi:hypothetical protein